MAETSGKNEALSQNANLYRLVVNNIFRGHFSGQWRSFLTVDRLIFIFETGPETGTISDSQTSCPLLPDTWIFIPALHQVRHDQRAGLQLISIHFNVELYSHVELFDRCGRILSGRAPELRETFKDFTLPDAGVETAFALKHTLWHMLSREILPRAPEAHTLRNRYLNFTGLLETIDRDPGRNLTVAEMAALMKMGRESFVKRFSAETGESPKAFFNRLRASAIARELCNPRLPISDIAEHFSFTNTFYFSRFFKRHFGIGPAAYRKKILSDRYGQC